MNSRTVFNWSWLVALPRRIKVAVPLAIYFCFILLFSGTSVALNHRHGPLQINYTKAIPKSPEKTVFQRQNINPGVGKNHLEFQKPNPIVKPWTNRYPSNNFATLLSEKVKSPDNKRKRRLDEYSDEVDDEPIDHFQDVFLHRENGGLEPKSKRLIYRHHLGKSFDKLIFLGRPQNQLLPASSSSMNQVVGSTPFWGSPLPHDRITNNKNNLIPSKNNEKIYSHHQSDRVSYWNEFGKVPKQVAFCSSPICVIFDFFFN